MRASFTVESSVITPLFVVIIMVFIWAALDMHDRVIVRGVDAQVSMKLEQELQYNYGLDSGTVQGEMKTKQGMVWATAVANIDKKCVLSSENYTSSIKDRIDEKKVIVKNRHPDFIRVISAGLKLLEE